MVARVAAALLLLLLQLLAPAALLHTSFNVEEITGVHYSVDILSKPVVRDQAWDGEVMTVVNKYGQEYICSLPNIGPLEGDYKRDEDILDQLVDISILLKPMETAPCLIKTVDWWTYEFCYSSVIKQYHLEDNKASGAIIVLGKYESEYNWKNSSETKNRLQRFHSQFYVNGTKCDLTGQPRQTEVRFHCEEGVGDYIQRVDEPESCRYVVTVATTRVCHHPYLRLQATRTPHTITCAPALTRTQYDKYLLFQEKKVKEEENLKKKWVEQNLDILKESEASQGQKEEKRKHRPSALLEPIRTEADDDDDDELKMNIKIFRLSPVKKNKNQQGMEAKEGVMEMETQITLEETDTPVNRDEQLITEASEDQVPPNTEEELKELADTVGVDKDEELLISNVESLRLLGLLDVSEGETGPAGGDEDRGEKGQEEPEDTYGTSKDNESDDYDDDEDDDLEEMEELRQASKSTKSLHFSKLQKRLKKLGKMFTSQEVEGARDGDGDRLAELQKMVDSIKDSHIEQLEKGVKDWTKKLLEKDELVDVEEDLEDEEDRLSTLSYLMDALHKAEAKLSSTKKAMETLEDFLDTQLKEMELSVREGDQSSTSPEESAPHDRVDPDSQDPIEGMSHEPPSPKEPLEESNFKQDKNKDSEKEGGSTRQLRIMKNKVEEESHKSRLEQTIKDRLQKLGLEKIGRKFDVKILTPNSLDDEEANTPLLSREETEAFQNMIVNLLSANAEEIQEKDSHRKLEKNYGFFYDENQMSEELSTEDTEEDQVVSK